ncbi:hypothetical protein HELRODRAFT_187946 [Helobdella robusta]|uniref:Uncharacterized protein n=1 Tax=Helobdella robusta TaxID=6412 RepID=T1FPH8_HELRO|nr:hypothetical protein HELRODRAFT_187946 [Helobdella robusta]ESO12662.1 hypothetical protein HELRODRAFT_187946 [Helobdella robusta]
MGRTLAQRRSCMSCVRYLIIIVNCLYMIVSMAIIGVFLWMALDQVDPVKGVTGSDLVLISVSLLVSGGILLLLSTCFGIAAASAENFAMMIVYIIAILLVLLAFVAASICIAVFKATLNENVRMDMENILRYQYGDTSDNHNIQITKSWDKAQSTWHCCAAGDKTWALYQESKWFAMNIDPRGKPFVPLSCCEQTPDGQIKNVNTCQLTKPPAIGDQYPGSPAPVYYRGCYETLKDFLLPDQVSWFTGIFWVGICGGVLMLFVIILGITFSVQIRQESSSSSINANELEFLSKSTPKFVMNSSSNSNSLSLQQTAPHQYIF